MDVFMIFITINRAYRAAIIAASQIKKLIVIDSQGFVVDLLYVHEVQIK